MRLLRGLLVPLLVLCVISTFAPSASFATPTFTKTEAKCKPKLSFCKPGNTETVALLNADGIFNERLGIKTDAQGAFALGAFPDQTNGDATPASWSLSFRWPDTSTSYTTIRIDNTDHTFGVDGSLVQLPTKVDARTHRTVWQIDGIEVTQTLQIGTNIHTGQKDTAIIAYTLRNTNPLPKTVGTRVMIDTEINQQDGFPFRVPGSGIVTNETDFTGANVPDVVLAAASSMTDTQVTAATLTGNGSTTPDRLVLAQWSNLGANPFDYTVDPNTSLTDDSAYAVYWNPKLLAAGESRTVVTQYGLGQATVSSSAPLALSVHGPATLGRAWNDYTPNPFDITTTVSNTGTTTTSDTQLTLALPPELALASGVATQAIGSLPAGQARQVSWKVRATLQATQTSSSYSIAASATGVAANTVRRSVTLPDLDATRAGPFATSTLEYRFNPQLHPDVIADRDTELWGRVYWPTDLSKGPYPLAIFLHGNHGTCGTILGSGVRRDDRADYTTSGSCPSGYVVTPNHEGYGYLGEKLAAWGYVVVSINANRGITAGAGVMGDGALTEARGRQVLKHLQLWQSWNATGTADSTVFGTVTPGYTSFKGKIFKGKIDFGNVGLMGHSRGGQGVRAAYRIYQQDGSPWPAKFGGLTIKGIFEIAPTDSNNTTNPALPPPFEARGTAWTVLLPMCDGDVRDLQGIRAFDRLQSQTSEQPATPKSTFAVWGTNHNYYNTEWQISDSAGCVGPGHTAIFKPGQTFGSPQQQQIGLASLLAFFRANVGAQTDPTYNLNFNPLATLPPVLTATTRVDRGYTVSPNSAFTTALETFSKAAGTNSSGVANESANITVQHDKVATIDYDVNGDGICDDITGDGVCDQVKHHDQTQRVGDITWTSAGAGTFFQSNWEAPGSGRDISAYATLDFRITRQISALNAAGATNFTIRLAHSDGSLSDPVALTAYTNLLGPVGVSASRFSLLHPILQTTRIPLNDFTNAQLSQVRGVRLTFDGTTSGAIYVANMQFSRQFEPTAFERQYVPAGAASFSVEPEQTVDQPEIEIEVYSPAGFPIRNATPVLRIGERELIISRYRDGSAKTLVFGLSAAEFAALPEGAPITLSYGADSGAQTWLFGPLSKSTLRYAERLQSSQQSARDLLADLRAQTTGSQEQRQLDAALQPLDRTLARGLWRDEGHLAASSAAQVFDETQRAVSSLQALMRANSGTIPSAVARDFLSTRLMHVLRGLAAQAIDEAAAGQPALDQARDALARGDDAALHDQFVSAVQHYRTAWQQAQRATP